MPAITFQQGVALAFGIYIDPNNSSNNKKFALVEETSNRNRNGVFAVNIRTGLVDNRLSALFHGRTGTDSGSLNFANNSAGSDLANLPNQVYTLTTTSTSVVDGFSNPPAVSDQHLQGYNSAQKQLDYRAGGDINANSTVSLIERNYHRTGLAIWSKIKK
jgi:hypothetical protein